MGNFYCQCRAGWGGRLCDRGEGALQLWEQEGGLLGEWLWPIPLFPAVPTPRDTGGLFQLRQEPQAVQVGGSEAEGQEGEAHTQPLQSPESGST